MPPPTSNFLRTGQPDPRLAQTATATFDATARQVLDQQVVDVQTLLALLQANGVVGSYVQIDPTSPVDVAKGDVLCRSAFLTRRTAVVAAAANLALAGGSVVGVALDAVPKGARCPYAALGVLPPEVTGLAPNPGFQSLARVSSAGRVESVPAYGQTDTPLGGVDSSGWLTLFPGGVSPQVSSGTYRGSQVTVDANPQPLLTVPFGDDAALTGTFSALALTPGVGLFQTFSAGAVSYTTAGVLMAAGTPTTNSVNTYGVSPSVDLVYDSPSATLTFRAIGVAATTITWRAVLAETLIILT